jgi:hypothetical protein
MTKVRPEAGTEGASVKDHHRGEVSNATTPATNRAPTLAVA